MKLAKFKDKKQTNTRNIMIAFGIIITFLVVGYISKSYAIYKLEKKYDIIQSKVGTFKKGDVQVSVLVDGEEASTFPTYQDNYYVESVECTNGVTASFDVENWQINIADMSATSTKCTVSFDSHKKNSVTPINMSKAQLIALNDTITNTAAAVVIDKVYPVGSIYISTEDDTVAKVEAKFGGEWEVYSSGKTLVGNDGTNYITGDSTKGSGGSSTVTLSANQIPTHSCSGTTDSTGSGYTISHTYSTRSQTQNLNHRHYNDFSTNTTGSHTHATTPSGAYFLTSYVGDNLAVGSGGQRAGTIGNIAAAGDHSHTVKGWTSYVNNSSAAWNITYSINDYYANKITGVEAHTHTFTGNYTNNSQTSVNVQNPYTVVYMYKRIS